MIFYYCLPVVEKCLKKCLLCVYRFLKIHRKAPVLESYFSMGNMTFSMKNMYSRAYSYFHYLHKWHPEVCSIRILANDWKLPTSNLYITCLIYIFCGFKSTQVSWNQIIWLVFQISWCIFLSSQMPLLYL